MKVIYKTSDGRMSFEIEADSQVEIFKEIASIQEVFEDRTCTRDGVSGSSDNVRFVVRKDTDENEYFEMVCMEPGPLMYSKKQFGVHKKGGGLFPKKFELKNGKKVNWAKYNPVTQENE